MLIELWKEYLETLDPNEYWWDGICLSERQNAEDVMEAFNLWLENRGVK